MYDLPRLNDRWATKPKVKNTIFKKHVDGEKNKTYTDPLHI